LEEPKDLVLIKLIKANPGIRYRELSRLTGFSHGVLSYHLNILAKGRAVSVDREARITRFYPANFSIKESRVLKYLRREPFREIVRFILEHDYCTFNDIVEYTSKAPSTVCQQLNILKKAGIIGFTQRDTYHLYSVAGKKIVSTVLEKYIVSYLASNMVHSANEPIGL
jgi:predicted transcriptional regulator